MRTSLTESILGLVEVSSKSGKPKNAYGEHTAMNSFYPVPLFFLFLLFSTTTISQPELLCKKNGLVKLLSKQALFFSLCQYLAYISLLGMQNVFRVIPSNFLFIASRQKFCQWFRKMTGSKKEKKKEMRNIIYKSFRPRGYQQLHQFHRNSNYSFLSFIAHSFSQYSYVQHFAMQSITLIIRIKLIRHPLFEIWNFNCQTTIKWNFLKLRS